MGPHNADGHTSCLFWVLEESLRGRIFRRIGVKDNQVCETAIL